MNTLVRQYVRELADLTLPSGGRLSQAMHSVDGFDGLLQAWHEELLVVQGLLASSHLLESLAHDTPSAVFASSAVVFARPLYHVYLYGQY